MNEEAYSRMVDWLDEHTEELELLMVSGIPGYLVTYYRGKLQMLRDVRCMIGYVRDETPEMEGKESIQGTDVNGKEI